jgi:hypothetical protein
VLIALLLSAEDVGELLGPCPPGVPSGRSARTIDVLLRRVTSDAQLAARLGMRLAARAARQPEIAQRSPYEVLALWGARTGPLPRGALGSMLWRLAGDGDPALAPLAERLSREAQLDALRGLPALAPTPTSLGVRPVKSSFRRPRA